MGRMSNRDRIARAAAEADAAAKEREEKKKARAAAPATGGGRKKAAEPVGPLKVVWEVRGPNGKTVKTFAYPQKAAAEAEAQRLTEEKEATHYVAQAKVPL